ncbi:MAG: SDR family NAD(P)-dependent oxidoreductase [Pseudonocardiaceae bacterium]
MRRFEGYAVLITGAGRGIGVQIARRFAAEGAQVLIADKDAARCTHRSPCPPGLVGPVTVVVGHPGIHGGLQDDLRRGGSPALLRQTVTAVTGDSPELVVPKRL